MQLSARQSDGATLRQHLQMVAARGGEVDPRLHPPPLPYEVRWLWDMFAQLSFARRTGGFGVSPLAIADIEAWCRLNGVRLTPWEFDTLLAVDAVMVTEAADEQRRRLKVERKK